MPIAELLTTAEVARLLGVSPGRVRQYVVEERLNPEKAGNLLLFSRKEVDDFARKPRPTGRPKILENTSCKG